MEIFGGSGLAVESTMKRKRSSSSRRPRANCDTLFQSYFGLPSLVEPFGRHVENENLGDTMVASDGVGTENKLKKLKLKFGGVTRTIHTKPKTEIASSCGSFVTNFCPYSDGPKPQDCTDGNDNVRQSKRIPKRRTFDLGFSVEDNEDAELHFLDRFNAPKVNVSCHKDSHGSTAEHGTSEVAERSQINGPRDYETPGLVKYEKKKLNSEKKYEDQDYVEEEDLTSIDESISERKKLKKGSVDLLVQGKKDKLSEMEQKLRKAQAAQRRKMQSEKAAREAEAEAIRKILGQDSGRKKKEEKMKKSRDEFAKEKSGNFFNLGSNTVRWTMGPTGTVVTFSEDIGLPSIFQMVPNSYPPPREKCAGPNCTNVYKYRDSKSKLPLCSLDCYRAIHEKIQPVVAC